MKKLISTLIVAISLSLTLTLMNVSATEVNNDTTDCNLIIKNNQYNSANEIATVSYEYQPIDFATSSNGCSTGKHLDVVSNGATDTTRVHGPVHPGRCAVYFTSYWKCNNCGATGKEVTSKFVWCPSENTIDSIEEIS